MEKLNSMTLKITFTDITKSAKSRKNPRSTLKVKFIKTIGKSQPSSATTLDIWTSMGKGTTTWEKLTRFGINTQTCPTKTHFLQILRKDLISSSLHLIKLRQLSKQKKTLKFYREMTENAGKKSIKEGRTIEITFNLF